MSLGIRGSTCRSERGQTAASNGSIPSVVHDATGTTNRYRRRLVDLAGNRGPAVRRSVPLPRDNSSNASSLFTAGMAPRRAKTASIGLTVASAEGVVGTRRCRPLAPHRGTT